MPRFFIWFPRPAHVGFFGTLAADAVANSGSIDPPRIADARGDTIRAGVVGRGPGDRERGG